MVRTLTLIATLALLAGLAVGAFAGNALGLFHDGDGTSPRADAVLEAHVRTYVETYNLSPAQADEIRSILRDYDADVMNQLKILRGQHQKEFKDIRAKAEARMNKVLPVR